MSFTKVSLEGDFLEAFLYSGILFTVDTDGILSTCSFKNLINSYLDKTRNKDSKIIKKYRWCFKKYAEKKQVGF